MKISSIVKNKILLAILAGITSIGGFQLWQHNQAEYKEFIAVERNNCEVYIEMGEDAVKRSPSLRALKYNNIVTPGLKQPGLNHRSDVDSRYLLLYNKRVSTLPASAQVYDDAFFRGLLKKSNYPPKSLLVTAVSFDYKNKKAVVKSYCAKEPFLVELGNLYEEYQTIDHRLEPSDSDLLF